MKGDQLYKPNSGKLPVKDDWMEFSDRHRIPFPKNYKSMDCNPKTHNMYVPNKYQQGGQPAQGQDQEMQMIQQILQAIQQLSPQGQQMLMQQLSGGGEQAAPEESYTPPPQRMGGYR